jgi:hypothetical protein
MESLKWLALILMTADHVNKYMYHGQLPGVYQAGRIVMPIFGFVLAYNLARPGALTSGAYGRVARRLAVAGSAATPAHVVLVGWWPANVLFTLLVFTGVLHLIRLGHVRHLLLAALLFCIGGAVVEFWWFALMSCLAAWAYCLRPNLPRLCAWTLATASLGLVNMNLWSCAAIPVILFATRLFPLAARRSTLFYAFYPLHLTLILVCVQ